MLALAIDLAGAPNAGARLPRQYKSRRTLDCHRDTSIRDPASLSGRVASAIGSIRILEGGITMKRLTPLLIAVATLAGVVAFTARAHSTRRGSTSRADLRNRNSLRIPRLEVDLSGP